MMDFLVSVLLAVTITTALGSPENDIIQLREEYGSWRLELSPEYSTRKGFYQWNDRLENLSPDVLDEIKKKVDQYLEKLNNIAKDELPEDLQIDYDMMMSGLKTFSDGYKWHLYGPMNPVSYLTGPQLEPSSLVSASPFNTKGDYENFLTRLKNYPKKLQQNIDRMHIAVLNNHTFHFVSMNRLEAIFDSLLTENPEYFVFYKPFNETLDNITTISDGEKTDMRLRAKASISTILDRFTYLWSYTKTVYMKNLRSGIGVSSWKNGSDYYRACLKFHLTLDMTPEEVHKIGLEEVERISAKMQKIMDRLGFIGSIKEFFASLQGNPRFFKSNASEILDIYNDMIHNQIAPTVDLMFKDVPNLPVEVRASPNDGPFGYYRTGSEDGLRPGIFFVNLFRPSQMSTTDFMSLAIHETNPGHHLQLSFALTADLPKYRKYMASSQISQVPATFSSYSAYLEGWALYAESLGEELKLYRDDYSLMGRYSSEIFRACRLVVDTGIHYFNWTRSQAINYFLNYTSLGQGTLENEVDRYSTWPGQACAYKIGELKIKELRKKAETVLGNKFDIKEFHATILKNGAMPLEILERITEKWIKKMNSSPPSAIQCDISVASNQLPVVILPLLSTVVQIVAMF